MNQLIPKGIAEKFSGKYPVPVIALANELDIGVFVTTDFANGEAGLIRKEKSGKYSIYINALDSPTRQRFTVAHELGHYFNDRDLLDSGQEFVDNIKQPVNGSVLHRDTGRMAKDDAERHREIKANSFAADLLMPEDEFKRVWNQSEVLETVADYFNVSPAAATIRAKELLGYFLI